MAEICFFDTLVGTAYNRPEESLQLSKILSSGEDDGEIHFQTVTESLSALQPPDLFIRGCPKLQKNDLWEEASKISKYSDYFHYLGEQLLNDLIPGNVIDAAETMDLNTDLLLYDNKLKLHVMPPDVRAVLIWGMKKTGKFDETVNCTQNLLKEELFIPELPEHLL